MQDEGGDLMRYEFVIRLQPVSKKNSQQIVTNKKTGRAFLLPSPQFKRYEVKAKRELLLQAVRLGLFVLRLQKDFEKRKICYYWEIMRFLYYYVFLKDIFNLRKGFLKGFLC